MRVVSKWNNLPNEVKNCDTVLAFKTNYDGLHQIN